MDVQVENMTPVMKQIACEMLPHSGHVVLSLWSLRLAITPRQLNSALQVHSNKRDSSFSIKSQSTLAQCDYCGG